MARPIDPHEYATKRNDILDAAQQLVFTKGYEQMSIQDILDALEISKGAFYHYFDSKASLLGAFIERGQRDLDREFLAIVEDPALSASLKLRRFFATLDQTRRTRPAFVGDIMRIWFADDNAIVREKLDEVFVRHRAPLLGAIVRQGIQEGVFSTPYPDQAGRIILFIMRGMENVVLKLILEWEQRRRDPSLIDEIVAASRSTTEAVERVLGASVPILDRLEPKTVQAWIGALSRGARRAAAGPALSRRPSTKKPARR